MPAVNMGQALSVPANPSAGKFVIMDPFSGPKGSPFDNDQTGNHSTGALNTGIGFGSEPVFSSIPDSYTDDYTPGVTNPDGSAATTAVLTAIGGGRSDANVGGEAAENPYNAQPILGFGAGGSRDGGAGPVFTGFDIKLVTATGNVPDGSEVETGYVNRSGLGMVSGESVFGSSTTASPAVA